MTRKLNDRVTLTSAAIARKKLEPGMHKFDLEKMVFEVTNSSVTDCPYCHGNATRYTIVGEQGVLVVMLDVFSWELETEKTNND